MSIDFRAGGALCGNPRRKGLFLAVETRQYEAGWNPSAALFAWLLPGLGHVLRGERHRGFVLAVTIGGLWLTGLLIGGVGVVDRKAHPFWFMGQCLVAPSIAVEQASLRVQAAQRVREINGEPDLFVPSLGRVHEQGVLFVALAGLLNLLAVIDVLYRVPLESALKKEPG